MQQAQFVSMVEVDEKEDIRVCKENNDCLNKISQLNNAAPLVSINLIGAETQFTSNDSYYIDIKIKNRSEYPIVQLDVHPGKRGTSDYKSFGLQDRMEQPVFIGLNEQEVIRIIVPRARLKERKNNEFMLSIDLVNVFDYRTSTSIFIEDLEPNKGTYKFKFRILKITDV